MKGRIALTAGEQRVFEYVVAYRREKHFSPSMRQIAQGLGLYSASTVHHHVHSIVNKGWFLPYDGTHGSIVPCIE